MIKSRSFPEVMMTIPVTRETQIAELRRQLYKDKKIVRSGYIMLIVVWSFTIGVLALLLANETHFVWLLFASSAPVIGTVIELRTILKSRDQLMQAKDQLTLWQNEEIDLDELPTIS